MIWKLVSFNNNYEISNTGLVKSLIRNIILKPQKDGMGYLMVALNGKFYRIHRLVAFHFVVNPNNYKIVNHLNCIKTDNNYFNLEWCTQKQNVNHAINNSKYNPVGIYNNNSILDLQQVLDIKQRLKNKETQKSIAKLYNVTNSTISNINTGKNWKHV